MPLHTPAAVLLLSRLTPLTRSGGSVSLSVLCQPGISPRRQVSLGAPRAATTGCLQPPLQGQGRRRCAAWGTPLVATSTAHGGPAAPGWLPCFPGAFVAALLSGGSSHNGEPKKKPQDVTISETFTIGKTFHFGCRIATWSPARRLHMHLTRAIK